MLSVQPPKRSAVRASSHHFWRVVQWWILEQSEHWVVVVVTLHMVDGDLGGGERRWKHSIGFTLSSGRFIRKKKGQSW